MHPLPVVNQVFFIVVQQECPLSVVPLSSTEPNSFTNGSNTFRKGQGVFGSSHTNKNASNKKCSLITSIFTFYVCLFSLIISIIS